MPNHKTFKSFKESQVKEHTSLYKLDSYDPKIRILQYDLVFVTGIPWDIASKQVLKGQLYFGRYGEVQKCIINPPYPFRKGTTYQAYATYKNQLDASLAIVALDGFQLGERPMKVSYGTSKYCSYFLKNHQCSNPDCFYLHQFDKQHQVINGDTKLVFKQQNQRAIRIVTENLPQVIEKVLNSNNQNLEEGFPSLSQMMQYLIDIHEVSASEYDVLLKEKIQKSEKKQYNAQNKSQKVSQTSNQVLNNTTVQHQTPTLTKNHSLSTMCSPNKQVQSTQIDIEQNFNDQRQNKKVVCFQDKNNQQVKNRQVQSQQGSKQSSFQRYLEFQTLMQEKITQKIIKQIMKKKTIRSKFEFVALKADNSEFLEEAKKIKNIIQRVLITYQ